MARVVQYRVTDFVNEDALPFGPVDQIDSVRVGVEDAPVFYRLAFLGLVPSDGDGMTTDHNRLRFAFPCHIGRTFRY